MVQEFITIGTAEEGEDPKMLSESLSIDGASLCPQCLLHYIKWKTYITLCCIALHNLLRSSASSRQLYTSENYVDVEKHATGTIEHGEW